jgi:hypothetical protein
LTWFRIDSLLVPGISYLEVAGKQVRSTSCLCGEVGGERVRQNRADCPDQSKYSATLNQLGVLAVHKSSMAVCKLYGMLITI